MKNETDLGSAAARRVVVTGSRSFRDAAAVAAALDPLHYEFGARLRLIQGGAAGADRLAWEWAKSCDVPCASFAPDYSRPSPQRYHERNDRMLGLADLVVAFWDGESRGTKSVIDKAEARGIPCDVVYQRAPTEEFREAMGDDGTGNCRGCGQPIERFDPECAVCMAALEAIHARPKGANS